VRAVFVAPNLNAGGLERQWSALVPGLVERGVDTQVVTLDGRGQFFDELTARGIDTMCAELHGALPVRRTFGVVREMAARDADVIVSAGVSAHVVGQLASSRSKASHVAALHAAGEWPMSARRTLMLRAVAPRVAASTAVTSAQLEFVRSLGFDTTKTHVIPTGVAAPQIRRRRSAIRQEVGAPPDAFVASLVAALRPEKRVDVFVEAVVAAQGRDPRIRGLIVGGGSELVRARELCRRTGSVVTALGHRVDVADVIHASDVVCLTSDTEALPLAALEAMACARAVVATDVGGLRDAVVDGETGLLVPPGSSSAVADALATLAADGGLTARLGEAGRVRHEAHFTLDRMVEDHWRLFRELAAARNGRPPARVARGRT
jgi:glycosyltransferase involved in cell wall biosynthesis